MIDAHKHRHPFLPLFAPSKRGMPPGEGFFLTAKSPPWMTKAGFSMKGSLTAEPPAAAPAVRSGS